MKNVCGVCGEKLRKKEDNAVYYCMKCDEKLEKEDERENTIKRKKYKQRRFI